MKTCEFLLFIVLSASGVISILANDLQNGFLKVFDTRNSLLMLSRSELTVQLQTNADVTQNRLAQTLTALNEDESRLQAQLDREDSNSTCIQNIQSIMHNTLMLSGFRLMNCAADWDASYRPSKSQVTEKVLREQLATHELPFLVVVSDHNMLIEEMVMDEELQARLKDEMRIAAEDLPHKLGELAQTWSDELESMNAQYEHCSNVAVNNFKNVVNELELRIKNICHS